MKSNESGQSVVEFGLMLLLIVILVFAVFQLFTLEDNVSPTPPIEYGGTAVVREIVVVGSSGCIYNHTTQTFEACAEGLRSSAGNYVDVPTR